MELAFRAAVEFKMTGRIPSPEEVAEKPLQWYKDVNLQLDWLQFHEDQVKPKPDTIAGGSNQPSR